MQVVECDQHLACECAHDWQRHAFVVVCLDECQQVVAEHLKHHAHMQPVGPRVLEAVQQPAAVLAVVWVAPADLAEQGDLVTGCLSVVGCTLLDLW